MSEWQSIETAPEGQHILLYWAKGERGAGGVESATMFRHEDGGRVYFSYWTHGGPNAGSDWSTKDEESPTHWMRLPDPPLT